MKKISILYFFKIGKLGEIELGFSKCEVSSLIGENMGIYNGISSEILKYGDIEFHFSDDELVMIFCDSLKFLYGDMNVGTAIDFDAWIFKKRRVYSFQEVVRELKKENINYLVQKSNDGIEMILESGVRLIYEYDDTLVLEGDNIILVGFELSIFNDWK